MILRYDFGRQRPEDTRSAPLIAQSVMSVWRKAAGKRHSEHHFPALWRKDVVNQRLGFGA